MNKIHIVRMPVPTEKDPKDELIAKLNELVNLQESMLKKNQKVIKLLQKQIADREDFDKFYAEQVKELEKRLKQPRIPGFNC
jgi:hypothetical protein